MAAERREDDLEEGRMPFLEHLVELRSRLRNAAIAFFIAFIACWFYSEQIYDWLREPLNLAWRDHADVLGKTPNVAFLSPTEPVWVYLSIAMWAGIFVSSPIIFHQIWKFIAPGLYKNERRIGIAFAVCSAVFFVIGGLFCYYFVLDRLYDYVLGLAGPDVKPTISMREYLDLSRDMMLAFGAIFELPLLIYFLALVGMVTHRSLWKFNRWFVIVAFIVGAVLTPSTDVASQVMMALPMIVLYNLSILIAYVVTTRRERRGGGAPPPPEDEEPPAGAPAAG